MRISQIDLVSYFFFCPSPPFFLLLRLHSIHNCFHWAILIAPPLVLFMNAECIEWRIEEEEKRKFISQKKRKKQNSNNNNRIVLKREERRKKCVCDSLSFVKRFTCSFIGMSCTRKFRIDSNVQKKSFIIYCSQLCLYVRCLHMKWLAFSFY